MGSQKEITLRDLVLHVQHGLRFLLKKWRWIVLCGILGLALGVVYALTKAPQYVARITFVTDTREGSTGGISPYAGLAAQLGINMLGNDFNGALFSGKNIYDLMKTRRMLENTLLTKVEVDSGESLLIDQYITMKRLKREWRGHTHLERLTFNLDTSRYSKYHNSIIAHICKSIVRENISFGKDNDRNNESSLLNVEFSSEDEEFSYLFLINLVDNVAKYFVDTKTKRARANLTVLQNQLDSVQRQLYGAMTNVASFQDQNQNLIRQGPKIDQQKNSLKLTVNSSIYQELVSAVETAKMNLQKETPLFEIVDKPILPLEKRRPNPLIWAIAGLLVGAVSSSMWFLCRRFYTQLMYGQ